MSQTINFATDKPTKFKDLDPFEWFTQPPCSYVFVKIHDVKWFKNKANTLAISDNDIWLSTTIDDEVVKPVDIEITVK